MSIRLNSLGQLAYVLEQTQEFRLRFESDVVRSKAANLSQSRKNLDARLRPASFRTDAAPEAAAPASSLISSVEASDL
jgi:hypothetical protein